MMYQIVEREGEERSAKYLEHKCRQNRRGRRLPPRHDDVILTLNALRSNECVGRNEMKEPLSTQGNSCRLQENRVRHGVLNSDFALFTLHSAGLAANSFPASCSPTSYCVFTLSDPAMPYPDANATKTQEEMCWR